MDKVKSVTKSGWHPSGKDGKKESWRGDFKGLNQVAGWVGKGKTPHADAQEHQSRPLASLKDPSAFGPPPKHVDYHGGAVASSGITPDRSELGASLNVDETRTRKEEEQRELQAAEESASGKATPPPIPYRADRTGLSTGNLPKPPVRRVELEGQRVGSPPILTTKPRPKLPPRLPPRQNPSSSQSSFSSPPPSAARAPSESVLTSSTSHGALRRLGAAGVNVSGLNIGEPSDASNSQPTEREPNKSTLYQNSSLSTGSQLTNLQSRFSKLSTTSPQPGSPSQGTTLAQKQAALKTTSSFRKDPSSVSLADARATASTANNFRERHGDQVASGLKSANALDKKYDISNRFGVNVSNSGSPGYGKVTPPSVVTETPDSAVSAVKKKPPPPVPKKIFSGLLAASSPPPVPLSSKPKP